MAAVKPRTIIHYPFAGDNDDEEKSGTLFVFGRANAPNLAILCAGYPDDQTPFSSFASRLAIENDCLVGVTCLPGYDKPYDRNNRSSRRRGGYTFEEMVSSIREAIRALRAESSQDAKKNKLIGIFHDWGVLPGMVYTNRALQQEEILNNEELVPNHLVIFDVLGPPHPSTQNIPIMGLKEKSSLYNTVVTWTYRVVLAVSFALQCYVSETLALIYFGLSFTILVLLRLNPTLKIDAKILQQRKMDYNQMIYMAYPYFNLFRAALTGRIQQEFQDMCLPADLNKTPVLYMYGLQKRIMFHSAAALTVLERETKEGRKSRAIAVPDAGHWLYLQQPDICLEAVKLFLLGN